MSQPLANLRNSLTSKQVSEVRAYLAGLAYIKALVVAGDPGAAASVAEGLEVREGVRILDESNGDGLASIETDLYDVAMEDLSADKDETDVLEAVVATLDDIAGLLEAALVTYGYSEVK